MSYATYIQNLKNQIADCKKAVAFGNLYNEGFEGYNPHGHSNTDYNRKNLALQQKRLEEALVWTAETTQKRRELWNSEVVKLPSFNKASVPASEVRELEERLGFTFMAMKEFIERHNLA